MNTLTSQAPFDSVTGHGPKPESIERARQLRRIGLVWMGALLLVGIPLSLLAPVSLGWENGWLEDVQVLVLIGGALMAWVFAATGGSGVHHRARCALGVAASVIWLVLAARELSWGAVFLEPVRVAAWGPVFSSSLLWYKPAVYPVVGALLLAALVLAWRAGVFPALWALRRRAGGVVIGMELLLAAAAAVLSTMAEGHLGTALYHFYGAQALVLEEWAETVLYGAVIVAQMQVFRQWRLHQRSLAA